MGILFLALIIKLRVPGSGRGNNGEAAIDDIEVRDRKGQGHSGNWEWAWRKITRGRSEKQGDLRHWPNTFSCHAPSPSYGLPWGYSLSVSNAEELNVRKNFVEKLSPPTSVQMEKPRGAG